MGKHIKLFEELLGSDEMEKVLDKEIGMGKRQHDAVSKHGFHYNITDEILPKLERDFDVELVKSYRQCSSQGSSAWDICTDPKMYDSYSRKGDIYFLFYLDDMTDEKGILQGAFYSPNNSDMNPFFITIKDKVIYDWKEFYREIEY